MNIDTDLQYAYMEGIRDYLCRRIFENSNWKS